MTTVAPPLGALRLELEEAAVTDRIVMFDLDPRHPERSNRAILSLHGQV